MLGSGYIQLSLHYLRFLDTWTCSLWGGCTQDYQPWWRVFGDPSKTVSKFSVVKWPFSRDQMWFLQMWHPEFNLVVVKLTFPRKRTWEKKVGGGLDLKHLGVVFFSNKNSALHSFFGVKNHDFPMEKTPRNSRWFKPRPWPKRPPNSSNDPGWKGHGLNFLEFLH